MLVDSGFRFIDCVCPAGFEVAKPCLDVVDSAPVGRFSRPRLAGFDEHVLRLGADDAAS